MKRFRCWSQYRSAGIRLDAATIATHTVVNHLKRRLFVRRFVSIMTVVALLLCTFSCASGMCCAASNAKQETSPPVERCCKCCRPSEAASDAPNSDDERLPEPCSCQGICAGAIVAKADTPLTAAVPCGCPLAIVESHACGATQHGSQLSFTDDPRDSCHSGRILRLHVCSLTC